MLSNDALIYTLISWISLVVNLFSIFLVIKSYLSSKSRPLIYLIMIYIFLTPFFIIHSVLYIIGTEQRHLMEFIFRLASFFIIAVVFALVLFIESLRVDKPSSTILIITAMGVGASLLLSTLPESIHWDTEIGPYLSDTFRLITGLELLILAIVIIYQITGFFPYIPETIGKNALLFYLATIIPIILPILLISLKISLFIWGIEIFGVAIGIFIMALAIVIDDRVLRILPFNVYRLSVMNMNIGMSIFDITFKTKQEGPVEEGLIPHLMTANIQFVQSVFRNTEAIRLIKTDNYLFIFELQMDIVAFIIADRSSILLKSALKEFLKEFIIEFKDSLNSSMISQYSKADRLINKHFSFLPAHKILSITS